jgi:hypothetical protein
MRELAGYRLDHDLEIPETAPGYSGNVLLRTAKELHRDAERHATRDGVSLNPWLTTALPPEMGPTKEAARAKSARIAEKKVRYRVG